MANTNPTGHDTWYMKLFESYDILDKEQRFNEYVQEYLRIFNRMFKYEGLPKTIPQRKLEEFLQVNAIVFPMECQPWRSADFKEKAEKGIYVFFGGYGGAADVYYERTIANIANPCLTDNGAKEYNAEIGKDCAVIFNDSQKQGLMPIIRKYSWLQVEADVSFYDALINLRIQSLIQASDDRVKASAELWLKNVIDGKPGIISGHSLDPETALATKPFASGGDSNALSQLIEAKQYLKAGILNELGLNANYNMKRERINSAETELNNDGLLPLVDDMLRCRKEGIEMVNAMYGTEITVEKDSAWEFRQMAAEVDAENPEGTKDAEQNDENEPDSPEEAAADSEEASDDVQDEAGEASDESVDEEKEDKEDDGKDS